MPLAYQGTNKGQRGLCAFVGGQGKNAVCESWCGLETGRGDAKDLGRDCWRVCTGGFLPGRSIPKNQTIA